MITPESILLAVSAGFGVLAAVKSGSVKNLKGELAEMTERWTNARKETHEVRAQAQVLEVQNAELRLRTDFEPVREKLNHFMTEQREVNKEQREFNSATLKGMQQISANQERLSTTLVNILQKLVPQVSLEELAEQDRKL